MSSYMTKIFLPFYQFQRTAELSVLPHKNIGYEFHFSPLGMEIYKSHRMEFENKTNASGGISLNRILHKIDG